MHVRCANVRLVTMLGSEASHEEMIRGTLAPNVVPEFLIMKGAPTLIKRRFIETYPFQKLFEIYVMDEQAAQRKSADLCAALEKIVPEFDVVIAADYGHGMIGQAQPRARHPCAFDGSPAVPCRYAPPLQGRPQ